MSPGRRTVLFLGVAGLAYAAMFVLATADFLPSVTTTIYDARSFVSPVFDKFNELGYAENVRERFDWHAFGRFLVSGEIDPGHSHQVFNFLPMILLSRASSVMPPFVAYNLLTLLYWVLSCVAVGLFALTLGSGRFGAFFAGALFGFCPYVQLQVAFRAHDKLSMFLLAFFFAASVRAISGSGSRAYIAAIVLFVSIHLCNHYNMMALLIFLGLALLFLLLYALAAGRPDPLGPALRAALGILGPGALILSPLWAYEVAFYWDQEARTKPLAFSVVQEQSALIQNWGLGLWSLFAVILAAAGCLTLARRGRKGAVMVALAAAAMLLLLIGLSAVPTDELQVLGEWPIAWRIRNLYSAILVPLVILVGVAGVGVETLGQALLSRRARVLGALLLVAGLVSAIVDGHRTIRDLRASSPSLELPPSLVRTIDGVDCTRRPCAFELLGRPFRGGRVKVMRPWLAMTTRFRASVQDRISEGGGLSDLYRALYLDDWTPEHVTLPELPSWDYGVIIVVDLTGLDRAAFMQAMHALSVHNCIFLKEEPPHWVLIHVESRATLKACAAAIPRSQAPALQ